MTALALALLSAGWLLLGRIARPTHACCPERGWWLEGIRPSGIYDCRRIPVGDDTWDAVHGEHDHSVQPPGVIVGRIYCGSGERPIAHWDGSVRCEATEQREARR